MANRATREFASMWKEKTLLLKRSIDPLGNIWGCWKYYRPNESNCFHIHLFFNLALSPFYPLLLGFKNWYKVGLVLNNRPLFCPFPLVWPLTYNLNSRGRIKKEGSFLCEIIRGQPCSLILPPGLIRWKRGNNWGLQFHLLTICMLSSDAC